MTKLNSDGSNPISRETCALDERSGRPICAEFGPRGLEVWLKGTRTRYSISWQSVFVRAAKLQAGYTDPPADRKRRRLPRGAR